MVAVIDSVYLPAVPVAGVPLSTPVAVLKVTPPGNAPVSANLVGELVAVTVKLPAVPTVKLVLLALVMLGTADGLTVSVNV